MMEQHDPLPVEVPSQSRASELMLHLRRVLPNDNPLPDSSTDPESLAPLDDTLHSPRQSQTRNGSWRQVSLRRFFKLYFVGAFLYLSTHVVTAFLFQPSKTSTDESLKVVFLITGLINLFLIISKQFATQETASKLINAFFVVRVVEAYSLIIAMTSGDEAISAVFFFSYPSLIHSQYLVHSPKSRLWILSFLDILFRTISIIYDFLDFPRHPLSSTEVYILYSLLLFIFAIILVIVSIVQIFGSAEIEWKVGAMIFTVLVNFQLADLVHLVLRKDKYY